MNSDRWYALQVRTRWEGSTAVILSGKGYETFLPTYKAKRRRNARLSEINAPLFPVTFFASLTRPALTDSHYTRA